jgi:hypothetical protein
VAGHPLGVGATTGSAGEPEGRSPQAEPQALGPKAPLIAPSGGHRGCGQQQNRRLAAQASSRSADALALLPQGRVWPT